MARIFANILSIVFGNMDFLKKQPTNAAGINILDIRGNSIIKGHMITRCLDQNCERLGQTGIWQHEGETTLNGREFTGLSVGGICNDFKTKAVGKGRISDDGYSITYEQCGAASTYRREK